MKARHKMSKRQSQKSFSKGAVRTHRFNVPGGESAGVRYVMRGGIRM